MAVLSGTEIRAAIESGKIIVSPYDENCLGPNSLDLRLGNKLVVHLDDNSRLIEDSYKDALLKFPQDGSVEQSKRLMEHLKGIGACLDMRSSRKTRTITIPEEGYLMLPGRAYLGRTVERIETDHYVPQLHGRSSVGRLFISVHHTAAWGDVGFGGTWTLEMTCQLPVIIYPGVRVCQVSFETLVGKPELYRERKGSRYQNQEDPTASLFWKK